MPHFADPNNSNRFYEFAEEVIQVPDKEDIQIRDPEVYMKRLREISSPSEQIKQYLLSTFNVYQTDPTLEGQYTRNLTLTGFGLGWLLGGLTDSKHLHQEYARKHNASVFDHNYRARRHVYDTFIYNMVCRGMPVGVKTGLLCLGAGIISFSSITYRCKLHYPDWLMGYALLGAVSRSWLGVRGLVGGAGFGVIGGTIGYCLVRGAELASGKTVAEFRYLEEVHYVRKRQAIRDRLQRQREDWVKDQGA